MNRHIQVQSTSWLTLGAPQWAYVAYVIRQYVAHLQMGMNSESVDKVTSRHFVIQFSFLIYTVSRTNKRTEDRNYGSLPLVFT